MAALEESYCFQLTSERCPCLDEVKELLEKWNLVSQSDQRTRDADGCLQVSSFCFDKPFQPYQKMKFCQDFLGDQTVQSKVGLLGGLAPEYADKKESGYSIGIEDVPCTLVNMTIFDKLYAEGVVRQSGSICKCFHEDYEDIPIDDELRKLLLLEDSDYYSLYDDKERSEFLFRIFTHVCIGGPICQFEDDIKPYLDVTRMLYKDLVSVVKDRSTSEIQAISQVFKLSIKHGDRRAFPGSVDHLQNFCYLVVDPSKKNVKIVGHTWL